MPGEHLPSPSTLPKPGDIVAGKYRIEHTLGSGGMGVVYQVTHRVTGKRFALKWLLPEVATQADAAKRFIREAQVAGRFEHPNVVEVYDVGSDDGSFYMVMELLEGESLADRITRQGALTVADTCRLLIPCMRGVAEAHSAGIVHRDLKPANIFVCRPTKETPESAKVLDFGISKVEVLPGELSHSMTRTGVLMGTPYYMPLEQMRGRDVDHRVDVYAFGVVLYQVLAGELPFQADSFSDLVLLVASNTPHALDELVPGVPPGLAQVISRAMARDPADRYPDLQGLIDALAQFDPKQSESLRPYSAPAPGASSRPPTAAVSKTLAVTLERPIQDSLAHPTPLSTESRPDLLSLPAALARRRLVRIASVAAAALVCGVTAWWLQRPEQDPHEATPKLSPAEPLVAEQPVGAEPRAAAAAAPSAIPAQPAASAAPAAPAPSAEPANAAATNLGSMPPNPAGEAAGDEALPQLNIVRIGVDPVPAVRNPPATTEPAAPTPPPPTIRLSGTKPRATGAASSSKPRESAALSATRTGGNAGGKATAKKPASTQADAASSTPGGRPPSRLPQITERDFY